MYKITYNRAFKRGFNQRHCLGKVNILKRCFKECCQTALKNTLTFFMFALPRFHKGIDYKLTDN